MVCGLNLINNTSLANIIYFVQKQNKPLIFVGLNDNTVYGKNKKLHYNVHSHHNYYIDIDDMIIVKQKCLRLLNDIQNDEMALNDLVNIK